MELVFARKLARQMLLVAGVRFVRLMLQKAPLVMGGVFLSNGREVCFFGVGFIGLVADEM